MGTIKEAYSIAENNSKNKSEKLSILLGRDSFFYLVIDLQGTIQYFHKWTKRDPSITYSDWVLRTLSQDKQLRKIDPSQTQIGIFSKQFTLIPVPFYEEPYKRVYLDRNVNPHPGYCYVDSLTTRQYIKVIYAVPPGVVKIKDYLGSEWPITHIMRGMIKSFYDHIANESGLCGLVHTRNDQQVILIFEDGKLFYSNIFTFRSDEDFYYFLSLVLSNLKIKPSQLSLFASGEMYIKTDRWNWLKKRFKKFDMIGEQNQLFGYRSSVSNRAYEMYDLLSIIQ